MLKLQSVVWDVLVNLEPNIHFFMLFAHTVEEPFSGGAKEKQIYC